MEAEEAPAAEKRRGKGRGSKFMVLDRAVLEQLWSAQTANRMNLVTAFLVMLAGTGADHRLTKWSAKACEAYTGMGKPRARLAIAELIDAGLVEHTETSTRTFPHYRLAPASDVHEAVVFLPVQLVTGLSGETPILRRIRETGDVLALRMLLDLYGLVAMDATHGVPLSYLANKSDAPAAKATEMGAHAVWALLEPGKQSAGGNWCGRHHQKGAGNGGWADFWERIATLRRIGAIWEEPWIFASAADDAEPLFPVDLRRGGGATSATDVGALTSAAHTAALTLAEDRAWVFDAYPDHVLVPLPVHHQEPALRGVMRMRVEPDTPGRRGARALRQKAIEHFAGEFGLLIGRAQQGSFSTPIATGRPHQGDQGYQGGQGRA